MDDYLSCYYKDIPIPDTIHLDLFRSKRTQNKVIASRKKATAEYDAWRATWEKQPDGSYFIPADKSNK